MRQVLKLLLAPASYATCGLAFTIMHVAVPLRTVENLLGGAQICL